MKILTSIDRENQPLMRNRAHGFILTLLMLLPLAGYAGGGTDCGFEGSWIGFDSSGAYWMSTASGLGGHGGTYTINLFRFDWTLLGAFPNAAKAAPGHGSWQRIGGNAFAFSVVSVIMDEDGNNVWIARLSGTDTVIDCNTLKIDAAAEVFLGDKNPLVDEPLSTVPFGEHCGYRITPTVDP